MYSNVFDLLEDSANAVPRSNKLRTRLTHSWRDRRGPPEPNCSGQASLWGTCLRVHSSPSAVKVIQQGKSKYANENTECKIWCALENILSLYVYSEGTFTIGKTLKQLYHYCVSSTIHGNCLNSFVLHLLSIKVIIICLFPLHCDRTKNVNAQHCTPDPRTYG